MTPLRDFQISCLIFWQYFKPVTYQKMRCKFCGAHTSYLRNRIFAKLPEKSADGQPSAKWQNVLLVLRWRTKSYQIYCHWIVKQLPLVVVTIFCPLISWTSLYLREHITAKLSQEPNLNCYGSAGWIQSLVRVINALIWGRHKDEFCIRGRVSLLMVK